MFCAAETAFLRAEGVLRGWDMGGSARDFYEQGVKLSFDQRKVSGADEYLANAVAVPEPFVDPVNPAKCNYTPKTKITIMERRCFDGRETGADHYSEMDC